LLQHTGRSLRADREGANRCIEADNTAAAAPNGSEFEGFKRLWRGTLAGNVTLSDSKLLFRPGFFFAGTGLNEDAYEKPFNSLGIGLKSISKSTISSARKPSSSKS
jgi:hypothetical protein